MNDVAEFIFSQEDCKAMGSRITADLTAIVAGTK